MNCRKCNKNFTPLFLNSTLCDGCREERKKRHQKKDEEIIKFFEALKANKIVLVKKIS
jgi:hypothetical protein